MPSRADRMRVIGALVYGYVVIALGTVAALAVLAAASPEQATQDAWVHALIVAVFAVLLPMRLHSAKAGSRGGLRAVGLISAVLFLVNVIGVMVSGLFPAWLRVIMVVIAALMAAIVTLVIREALVDHRE